MPPCDCGSGCSRVMMPQQPAQRPFLQRLNKALGDAVRVYSYWIVDVQTARCSVACLIVSHADKPDSASQACAHLHSFWLRSMADHTQQLGPCVGS